MAIHLCRDYITQNVTTGNRTYIYAYLLAIFMRRVLGYSHIGNTNFNINSVGTLLIATGDTTPTVAPTFPPGNRAGINLGTQKEFFVSIPVGVRTVGVADIGRILVLRSTSNPTFNSGLFVIVGFDVSTNSYIIDYRTLGDKPPMEPADSMNWYLYEKDVNCPTQGGVNTLKLSTQYRSDGNSSTPRIMLQSPHAINYQVRICNEGTGDFATDNGNGTCPVTSVSLGFGGNSAGDFTVGGSHTHAPQWADSSSIIYLGGAPGLGDGGGGTGTQFRVTMIGGDDGYGAAVFARRPGNAVQPTSFVCVFGLPFNEPLPLPINPAARLFTIGSGYMGNDASFGNRTTNDMGLQAGIIRSILNSNNVSQGMSYSPFGAPVMCAASFWAYITGGAQNSGPQLDASATDTPFINTTELLPLDLIQGTLASWNTNATPSPAYPLAPRLMGTIPYIYEGRANFGDFSPSTDPGRSFQHMRRGLYIPWNGPNIIP